jgi:two-component system chemotaxis response regulator CheY
MNKRVLIIDDNGVSRSLLRLLLQEEGFIDIDEASSGEQGLRQAERMEPELVFLDIEMPRMGGLEVLVTLRKLIPGAVVIMVTSNADRMTVQAAADEGASGYILKPFTQRTVLQALSTAYSGQNNKSSDVFGEISVQLPGYQLPVFIVEDDHVLLKLYQAKIARWTFPVNIRWAANGYDGLLSIRDFVPKLLICDLRVPKVTGFQILNALSRMEQFRETRIVVVSGLPPDDIKAQGGLPNGVELLGKPIDFQRLEAIAYELWKAMSSDP